MTPPADLNGLFRFAERRNLVSARAPSRFKRNLPPGKAAVTVLYMGMKGPRPSVEGKAKGRIFDPAGNVNFLQAKFV